MSQARIFKIPINNCEEKMGPGFYLLETSVFLNFRNKKTLREFRKLKKDFHIKKPETRV